MAAIPQVHELLKRPDPLFQFKWACLDDKLPFGLPSHYLESVDLPFNNLKIGETIYGGGCYFNTPGSHSIGAVNMVFYEDQKASALKWIQLWKSKVKNMSTGFYELPGDGTKTSTGFKRQLDIQLLNTKNEPILTAELIGLWPENTSNWTLSYTDDGRLTISQSFSIDDLVIKFL